LCRVSCRPQFVGDVSVSFSKAFFLSRPFFLVIFPFVWEDLILTCFVIFFINHPIRHRQIRPLTHSTTTQEKRKGQFKKQDFEIGRRRREETAIQLRKSKKEDQLMKRRQINAPSPSTTNNGDEEGNSNSKVYTVTEIPKLMSILINPSSPSEFEEAVRGFRRMLSVEVNPPVNEVIAGGAMPYLINALDQRNNNASVIFEAAWALTNIASTDRTKDVVAAGVVAPLILLLKNDLPTIREQAAWCLGNIAGDCPELRDIVLKAGALEGL